MTIDIVILAAGQGSRMKSTQPKVLHRLAGRSLVQHVIDQARQLDAARLHLVVGHGAEQVQEHFEGRAVEWALQEPQLGTGHALQQAMPHLQDDEVVVVLYGDVPLV